MSILLTLNAFTSRRHNCARQRACQHAKIRNYGGAILQEDVLRLDVAVNDPLPMCVLKRAGHFARDAQRIRYRPLLLALEACTQRLAAHVGHDVEQQPIRRTRVEQR